MSVFRESPGPQFGTITFLVLGWGGLISCILLWKRYGFSFVSALLWGGVAYKLAAVIMTLNRPTLVPGIIRAQELWYLAVLTGLGLH